ncbi:unnamed protein product [Paramecium pentaurelia]|uniref:Uncharacterized protein n=1 Tax=Paramecium pentaurelia TaxID=43138 RepID=A0A8S1TLM0_9CILI|nr:unnamed protein product [Paramecium pentaurelia]
MNYKDADPEGSVCSQPTASQTGENFHQKKVTFARSKHVTKCSNCQLQDVQLKKMAEQIQNIEEQLISFQKQIDEKNQQNKKQKQKQEELLIELQIISEKHHQELINNGILQKQNIELRKEILKLEQDISKVECQNQEPLKRTSEQKFIESLIQMFMSFHQKVQFPTKPQLKQVWKWLKQIVSEYAILKQKELLLHK